ncbi:hypothetical protein PSCICL_12370 [Pseudomonas cichorii]|nr:hypothetical protein [Pseudomonas capsici]GFM52049.1 hypothetical protein PSCICE_33160 [Pseudomonas cichorii]GFM55239.1 hypothetical protein PSCICF_14170 [Pseudomonas cichorii]GFM61294.1 hypothetical protein PSCICG_24540 [Pseudomonas cichorii]GFM70245.1 hypothetical protein PSCICL_12370 [Pseudomonas cichorii]
MYRRPLLIAFLALFMTGCYAGPGYYESEVYTQPTTVVAGGYAYDNGYRSSYYQERRIYVAPQPRYYYSQPPRYYAPPPPPRYYGPPPQPRYYNPGRPPGNAWRDNRFRGNDGYRNNYRNDYRNDYRGGGRSWDRGRGDGRY